MAAGHACGSLGRINGHEALRFQSELVVEPLLTLLQDVGTVLLDRVNSFFARDPGRPKRYTIPISTNVPRSISP